VSGLPGCSQMSLYDPCLPLATCGGADIGADIGLRHPAVQDVNARLLAVMDDLTDLLPVVALQPLRSQTDLAYHKSCVSQCSVIHVNSPFSVLICSVFL